MCSRRRQAEGSGGPRQRRPGLPKLNRAHVRPHGYRRLTGVVAEVRRDHRREARRDVGRDVLRWRTALGVEARQPRGDVEPPVAHARPVPIDESGTTVEAEADVVAPHVEVQELATVERRRLGRTSQRRQRVGQPVLGAQAEPKERLGIALDLTPAPTESEMVVGGPRKSRGRRRRGNVVQTPKDRVDPVYRPRRRPHRTREVLEREDRPLTVVVETDEPRHERRTAQRGIRRVLVPDPTRGELVGRDLDERRGAFVDGYDPSAGGGVSAVRGCAPPPRSPPQPPPPPPYV